jgi:hypothetical protein
LRFAINGSADIHPETVAAAAGHCGINEHHGFSFQRMNEFFVRR